jgi:hypothetical protein
MTFFSRDSWWALTSVGMFGFAFAGCTVTPLPPADGQTTTTYGNSYTSAEDGVPSDEDTGDSEPGDPTDSGPSTTGPNTTGPGTTTGPSDEGPDPFLDFPNQDGLDNGATCTSDEECNSGNCYVVPFLGGSCGECNQDSDCFPGGCTPYNPFEVGEWSVCNMGEAGAGCESDEVCAGDLSCAAVFDLLGLIIINTCGSCVDDSECGNQICAPLVDISQFGGQMDCIEPNSLPQDAYCSLEGNGADVCASGKCAVIDIMGLAEIGACGECNNDLDCDMGTCVVGEFVLDSGTLVGSTCQ